MIKKILKKYPVIGQFVRFGLIGGLNTGVDLVILNILMFSFSVFEGTGYSVLKATSFCFAATLSYFLNKYWAFRDNSENHKVVQFSQFFVVSVIGAIINVSVATLIVTFIKPAFGGEVEILMINPLKDQIWGTIGALGGTAIGLIWNFLGYKLLVFKK
jgi:putative flippase GtrA